MGIDFPKDKDEAGIGSGALAIGDEWYSLLNKTRYEVVAFNDDNEAVWKSKPIAANASGDPTLQEVLNAGNTAVADQVDTADFTLGDPAGRLTTLQPAELRLTDETTNIGPRVVFNSTESSFTSRISVKKSDRLILETTNNEGVWVNDRYINNQGDQEERDFRIIPSDRQFALGIYSIFDVIFGGPVEWTKEVGETAADGTVLKEAYTREDWTKAFNRALQNNPIRPLAPGGTGTLPTSKDDPNFVPPSDVLKNGKIKTIIFPAGTYHLLGNVVRTENVRLVGEGRGVTRFEMEERVDNDSPNDPKVLLYRCPPTLIESDGMKLYGQFCLANKGDVRGISFKGHQSWGSQEPADKDAFVYDYPYDPSDYENDVPTSQPPYSAVLAFRAYANNGYRFGTAEATAPEYDDNGYVMSSQNDSADMDTAFIDCGFGSRGKGGDREGILKYVGRNGYISGCSFNSNYNGLVLTFPNRAGWDWTDYQIKQGNTAPICSINQSLGNESQGGVYGWRRMQILGCYFHMDAKANCVLMYGKYQCCGMVMDGNLSDIGGKMLNFCSTGTGGTQSDETDQLGRIYSNGVGGGLKNCVISNNSFGNQMSNGAIISFEDGRYDGNVITGNSFYGMDNTYKGTDCPAKAFKRCKNAIVIKNFKIDKRRGCVVRNLSITNNNFAYFTNSAIVCNTLMAEGLVIANNTFLNIGCGGFKGDPNKVPPDKIAFQREAAGIYVMHENSGIFTGNMLLQEDLQGASDKKMGKLVVKFRKKDDEGEDEDDQKNTTPTPQSWQKVINNFKRSVSETREPGRFCTSDNTKEGVPLC